jgi:hypothetical protein
MLLMQTFQFAPAPSTNLLPVTGANWKVCSTSALPFSGFQGVMRHTDKLLLKQRDFIPDNSDSCVFTAASPGLKAEKVR